MTVKITLDEAQAALRVATCEYSAICQEDATVSREKSARLNKVNQAQTEFDEALERFKSQFRADGTDWAAANQKSYIHKE